MPLTFPRQVSPEYGTRIVSVVSSAVPVSEMAQDVRPGAVAFPCALQEIVDGVCITPCAMPETFRSPAQVALNVPFAVVAVFSDTFHLKSVHVLGVGIRLEEVQFPNSALVPATVGLVGVLLWSKPVQPTADAAAIDNTRNRIRFFISGSLYRYIGHTCPEV